jgi:dTDP-glucose 4,6-dehydratase
LGKKGKGAELMRLLVTGGAGFIGSNFIRYWLNSHPNDFITNLDALTYAGHLESLRDVEGSTHYRFIKGDITNPKDVKKAIDSVDIVVNFAAESHVDRSIIDPLAFVKTNVLGTAVLLDAAMSAKIKRFHHISTDEVFGQLDIKDRGFNEETKYDPRTPYSASKAGSDHIVRAYFETYGLPVTISNCSNNFGPFQDPEKLISRFITNLMESKKLPLMGKGENIRDWIYVQDHNEAVDIILHRGVVGETYCIGGEEKSNLEVSRKILKIIGLEEDMIEYVEDRLGHDFRYAIDDSKIRKLGWKPKKSFDERLIETIEWYRANEWWWKPLKKGRPSVDRSAQKAYG